MPPSVGEILRKSREQKRLTVEQAAFATHIKPEYIKALEFNERELLPSLVQGKGFLRLYAGYLELDVDQLLRLWDGIEEPEISAEETLDEEIASEITADFPEVEPVEDSQSQIEEEFFIEEISSLEPADQLTTSADWHFQQFGQKLRERRQDLGLQHQDIEKYIHVRSHYLKALEEGRVDAIPSFVQCQGMLSNYAKFLNLDENEILQDYANGLQARREALLAKTQPEKKRKSKPLIRVPKKWKKLISTDLLIVGGVILSLMVFAFWAAAKVTSIQNRGNEATKLSVSDILLNTSIPTTIPTNSSISEATETPVAATAMGVVPTTDPNQTPDASSTSPIQLTVRATQRSWVRISADEEVVFNGFLTPGNIYPFYASKELILLTGNAGTLQVVFNQKDLGDLGGLTDKAELQFTLQGLIIPTPEVQPTSTPTVGPTPTITPSPTLELTPTVTPYLP